MTDIWSKKKRSGVMSRIRSRDTVPELLVRSLLHRSGLRFSTRRLSLLGRPDIVLPSRNTVIFVHGCFWHRHKGCPVASNPSTRAEFWEAKFKANQLRDRKALKALIREGWKVLVVWECEVMRDPARTMLRLCRALKVKGTPLAKLPPRLELVKRAKKRLHKSLDAIRPERENARAGKATQSKRSQ